jgi:amino acid transporter
VGGIIGMGIYALIAGIGAQAGNALWLAFTLAIIISVIGVIPLIFLASAMPRAGAGYLFTSRLLNPLWGSIASYFGLLGGACSTAFVSIGISGYIAAYLPWKLDVKILSLIVPTLFFILYLFRLRLANWLQILMVIQLILALSLYVAAGSFQPDHQILFNLALPQGTGGLILATVLCYSTCMGFQVIAEMGEEIKNARRNIPLALFIGGLIVLGIYIMVGTVFVSSVPYDFRAIKAMKTPLLDTAKMFLSPGWVAFVSFGALTAALTSLNAGAIALPRELLSQARDGFIPAVIGKVSKRTQTPLNAVGVYFLVVLTLLCGQFIGLDIDFYGVMAAIGILLMTVILSVASMRMPMKYPDLYNKAYLKISRPWLIVIAALSIITSLLFIALVLSELPMAAALYVVATVLIITYYYLRNSQLKKQGIDLKKKAQVITGFEEE